MNCCNHNCGQGTRCPLRRTTTDTYEEEPLPFLMKLALYSVFGGIGLWMFLEWLAGTL